MKVKDILGNIRVAISEEENDLVERIQSIGRLSKENMSERDRQLAKILTTRGVLRRLEENNKVFYKFCNLEKVKRI